MRLLVPLPIVFTVLAGGVASSCQAEDLVTLYQQVLSNNPGLKIQEYAIDQTAAQRDQLKSLLLPQLSATGSYTWNMYDDNLVGTQNYTGTRGTLQARQPLVDFSTRRRIEGANEATLQAEQQRDATRMQLAGELIDRYLNVLAAADDFQQLQAETEATQSQLTRLRYMHARQLAKVTDLYEVEAYYSALQTREIEVRNAKSIALAQLRETTGVDAQGVPGLAITELPALAKSFEYWRDAAVDHSPTLAALSHATEAASKLIESALAQHLPRVDLVGSVTYSNQGYDNRDVAAYNVRTFGAQLTIPLYEGGRVANAEREAKARNEIARQQYEQSVREIERQIRTAYLNAEASYARITSKTQEVTAFDNVLVAQKKNYQRGASTIVDVLTAQQRLYRARAEQAKARYDYIREIVGLHILSGGMTEDFIKVVSGWMETERT